MRPTQLESQAQRRQFRTISAAILVLLILVSAMPAQSQFHAQKSNSTGDWQAVKRIQPGTNISVRAGHRIKCVFSGATDTYLTCVRVTRGPTPIAPANITFSRLLIGEVCIERSTGTNAAAGAAIGGGLGVALGASSAGCYGRGPAILVGGGLGALTGALSGSDFSFLPRKIIYRR
jgi:hypothetical protein